MKKLRMVSGIQPTGRLHLGNYLGAIKNWVTLQEKYPEAEKFYFIADLHALTNQFSHDHDIAFESTLKRDTINIAAYLLASGLDPEKSVLFLQSHVPEHNELNWIFSCIAPMNWLNKMTQYKDKKSKSSSLGLFSYPVLMASDILLYKANMVPVGLDQKQHIELTRDYAVRFNSLFCKKSDYFFQPQYVESNIAKVMSLRDANTKMSKSDKSDFSRINLDDEPEVIFDKIRKAKTDSITTIKYDLKRPEVANLMCIYGELKERSVQDIEKMYSNKTIKEFKEDLAGIISEKIFPIKLRAEHLMENKEELERILNEGSQKARDVASKNIREIKKLMNFYC